MLEAMHLGNFKNPTLLHAVRTGYVRDHLGDADRRRMLASAIVNVVSRVTEKNDIEAAQFWAELIRSGVFVDPWTFENMQHIRAGIPQLLRYADYFTAWCGQNYHLTFSCFVQPLYYTINFYVVDVADDVSLVPKKMKMVVDINADITRLFNPLLLAMNRAGYQQVEPHIPKRNIAKLMECMIEMMRPRPWHQPELTAEQKFLRAKYDPLHNGIIVSLAMQYFKYLMRHGIPVRKLIDELRATQAQNRVIPNEWPAFFQKNIVDALQNLERWNALL